MTKFNDLVRADDLLGVRQALAAGADPYAPDDDGYSALQRAAMSGGNTLVLNALLSHPVEIRRSSANGWDPLILALKYSHYDAAELLIDRGADVNARQPIGGQTPLHFAAAYGQASLVRKMLRRGADPRATDESGATACDQARICMEGTPTRQTTYREIVELLEAAVERTINKRAAPTQRDDVPGEKFFAHWRENRVASMTLVDLHADGALYFYASPYNCTVWVFVGADSLIVSYSIRGDGPEQVRAEMRRLLDALHGDSDSDVLRSEGYPNYAAHRGSAAEKLRVACFHPGDWYGLTRIEPLLVHWDQLPPGWPETYRSKIAELVEERIHQAERDSSFAVLDATGRALVKQSLHEKAERIYRRALQVCESTYGADHADTVSSLHALGITLAFQNRYAEAETLMRRALADWIRILGPSHQNVASMLNSLANVLERQCKQAEANALRVPAQASTKPN